jgi:sphingolipid 4-desaturase/C4-monooxygenase
MCGLTRWLTRVDVTRVHRPRPSRLQVRALYGPDPMIKWKVAAAIATQLAVGYLVADMAWLPLLALAYCVGGVINHSMTLAMHEVSHNLAFKTIKFNRVFGMITNLPLGIPSFA